MVAIKKVDFFGFKDALLLSNGIVDLIITTDVGPRILFYGFTGGQNFMKVFENETAPIDDNTWHSYGGHRLWYAPEKAERTYYPDNKPVAWAFDKGVLTIVAPDEESRWLGKRIVIRLSEDSSRVEITHYLKNIGLWPLDVSAWCLTVMAPGGTLKVPQPPYIPHGGGEGESFDPARSIVCWHFTKMNDPRLQWSDDFMILKQDDSVDSKIKLGMHNEVGYALYELNGEVFRKDYSCIEGALYPDMNCNTEFFTMPGFLEIESLSPVTRLAEGESLEHTEVWSLSR